MKLIIILGIQIFLLAACERDLIYTPEYYQCSEYIFSENQDNPKNEAYQQLLEEMVGVGLPGIMMTISDSQNRLWSGAAGKSDLASGVDLLPCNISRVGSTVKTFTAATVLLLAEEGKLALDDKISLYLSPDYQSRLANWEKITIRQLLQHTSGLYNYIANPHFQTASLNNLTKDWKPEELMSYAHHQTAVFEPGTDAQYSNTNYILLGELISTICNKPFFEVFNEKLFIPFNLKSTHFAATDPVPEGIIQGYADFYGNRNLINTTLYSGWDYYTADGGLISNAYDLNHFLTTLFKGEIISNQSMAEMASWIPPNEQDEGGFETFYGLGIFKFITEFGPAYLHSGDAIGYFASMVYFPEQQTTITWAVNGNYGALDDISQSKEAMLKIFETVLKE